MTIMFLQIHCQKSCRKKCKEKEDPIFVGYVAEWKKRGGLMKCQCDSFNLGCFCKEFISKKQKS
jgi:hypothetical protein